MALFTVKETVRAFVLFATVVDWGTCIAFKMIFLFACNQMIEFSVKCQKMGCLSFAVRMSSTATLTKT